MRKGRHEIGDQCSDRDAQAREIDRVTLPLKLGLRQTPEGPRLIWQPVAELAALRGKQLARLWGPLPPGDDPLAGVQGELLEIRQQDRR